MISPRKCLFFLLLVFLLGCVSSSHFLQNSSPEEQLKNKYLLFNGTLNIESFSVERVEKLLGGPDRKDLFYTKRDDFTYVYYKPGSAATQLVRINFKNGRVRNASIKRIDSR